MGVAPTGLTLSCKPGREGRTLVFEYALANPGERVIYVQDAVPAVDRASRAVRANPAAFSVVHGTTGDAVVGKFVPPMPTAPRPAMAVTPLARRLAPGETLARRLEAPEPLAESSPYFPDLLLREYEVVDIPAVVFAVAYWFEGTIGMAAMPTPYAEGLFSVMLAGGPATGTKLVSQRFATRGLQVFRRRDAFLRTVPG